MSDYDEDEDLDEIKDLMRKGFEQAFIAQIGQLYKVYLSNVESVSQQPQYTRNGIENAAAAYRLAIAAVDGWGGDAGD